MLMHHFQNLKEFSDHRCRLWP